MKKYNTGQLCKTRHLRGKKCSLNLGMSTLDWKNFSVFLQGKGKLQNRLFYCNRKKVIEKEIKSQFFSMLQVYLL